MYRSNPDPKMEPTVDLTSAIMQAAVEGTDPASIVGPRRTEKSPAALIRSLLPGCSRVHLFPDLAHAASIPLARGSESTLW
jgi:hypothetical protein